LTAQAYEFVGPVEPRQHRLERELFEAGRNRALRGMEKRERDGHADQNPYAQALYRRWLFPLRDRIEAEITTPKAGKYHAHVALLKPLDPASVAFLSVRHVLICALRYTVGDDARAVARSLGTEIYRELVLAQVEHMSPELYWEIVNDIDRRNSKDARYKYRVIRDTANSREIKLPDWGPSEREKVGLWLIEGLRVLGMVEVARITQRRLGGVSERFEMALSDQARSVVENIKDVVEVTLPYHLPCIEQPHDWTRFNRGGYHTEQMRRLLPHCINVPRANRRRLLDLYFQADLSTVMRAINRLQAVRWQVNIDMLNTVRDLSRRRDTDEIVQQADIPKPNKPEWLVDDVDKSAMTPERQAEFKQWKRQMAEWYTERKLRRERSDRFYTATRIADKFKDEPVIHFLYQADFRGRLYAVTTGISPQGSDLQKCLLRFADGKPLDTEDAVKWFKINGANRFGVDKVSFEERLQWVDDNDEAIRAWAHDPLSHSGWDEADSPLQFLAWCKEYAQWRASPANFVSRIPVGLDGSCNGLQHFSAMLRDSVGGRATNLTPADRPNDIYQQVASVVQAKLTALKMDQLTERDSGYASKWIKHGINRKLVKRSVMTLPYGSTRYSCAEFIVGDYLKIGAAPEFSRNEYTGAANFLSYLVWEAIGEVVVAARLAMEWLQKCASTIIKAGESQIRWTTPSSFPVMQVYNSVEVVTVRSLLLGGVRLRVGMTGDDPNVKGHKNGISPNFVHSMDAAHLALVVCECDRQGIDALAMIHDDYGTHAADAQKLFMIIREVFVRMYEQNNPLAWFRAHYDGLPEVPEVGSLDIREVLSSPYFFA
jgi:DNA-directed RNA polymerase